MKQRSFCFKKNLVIFIMLWQGISFSAFGDGGAAHTGSGTSGSSKIPGLPDCQILAAARVFDGINFPQENMAVLIEGDKIKQVGTLSELSGFCANQINLGNATILPGFIERHGHITFQNVDKSIVLEHGITSVQDVGGPLMPMEGGQGTLRLLSAGPIIQAVDGYPLNIFGGDGGYDKIGITVSSAAEAEAVVDDLVNGGATAIVISLELGGEPGRHWMTHGNPIPDSPWPMLSEEIVQAIVTKAHLLDRRVLAFVGEETGVARALNAKVDELVHMPCGALTEALLQRVADENVTVVTTMDTHSSCEQMHANAFSLGMKGAKIVYGSEIAHGDVPWGINGEELHIMLHTLSGSAIDFEDVVNVLKAATSKAGEDLGVPGLGTLTPGAPADVIAVRGNPFEKFKILEYPDLVISGGRTIINKFMNQPSEANIECFFTWAEEKYPDFLAPSGAATEIFNPYSYRYYPETRTYLGVSSADNHVYYMKTEDGLLRNEGPLANWLPVAGCQ